MSARARVTLILVTTACLIAVVTSSVLEGYCTGNCDDIPNAKCNDGGKCECIEGYSKTNNSACGRNVNDFCFDGKCDARNSQCIGQKCSCPTGYKVNRNNTFCFTTPEKFGDLCDEHRDCDVLGQGKECVDGYCVCQDDFAHHTSSGLCKYKISQIGDQCNSEQICYLERDGDKQNVDCVDGYCKCRNPKKEAADKLSCNGGAILLASVSGLLLVWLTQLLS